MIAVRLAPEDASSRWYPGAGIYRNVWLVTTGPVHVAHWGTYVTTPEVVTDEAAPSPYEATSAIVARSLRRDRRNIDPRCRGKAGEPPTNDDRDPGGGQTESATHNLNDRASAALGCRRTLTCTTPSRP